jgi:hypothetical protein
LAEFPSAVEAVHAAIEIQKALEHAVPYRGQSGRCD